MNFIGLLMDRFDVYIDRKDRRLDTYKMAWMARRGVVGVSFRFQWIKWRIGNHNYIHTYVYRFSLFT